MRRKSENDNILAMMKRFNPRVNCTILLVNCRAVRDSTRGRVPG